VRSRQQELFELLAETRATRLVAKSTARPRVSHNAAYGFGTSALIGLVAAMDEALPFSAGPDGRLALAGSCGVLGGTVCTVATRWYLRRSRVELRLHEVCRQHRQVTAGDVLALALAAAILLATIAGIVIAHRDATRAETIGGAARQLAVTRR
jgi:hypothetical protein